MKEKLTFIGAGNMASAIFGGLIDQGYSAEKITATSPDTAALTTLNKHYAINTSSDNIDAISHADVIILAVKPQILREVCAELKPFLSQRQTPPLIISIAAGIPLNSLQLWLGAELPIIRAMPNTPALVGLGATALCAGRYVSDTQKALAEQIHTATGITEWLEDEKLIDAVTAVSGSAPAYFFLLFCAMEDAAVAQGLPRATARRLALQTGLGAASMALNGDTDPEQLMRNVMSPQGSTERAIDSFEAAGLRQIVDQAMRACAERAREMQASFGSHTPV